MASVVDKFKASWGKAPSSNPKKAPEQPPGRAMRETIESVVIAIILAFLFRTFEAEAFVIPTGSMAPTLQGAHRDVACDQCGYRFRTGASSESPARWNERGQLIDQGLEVVGGVCPICHFPQVFDPVRDWNEKTHNGDRILVSKFAYHIGEPERWDPIVFKFPGNAKQNYIKRLVGLPGEKGRIFHGDVFAIAPQGTKEEILRKPPHKLVAMLQLVDDTDHVAPALVEAKWPDRWQPWTPPGSTQPASWKRSPNHKGFATDGQGDPSYLRYRHLAPLEQDWKAILQGRLPDDIEQRQGMLITDFYTYNSAYVLSAADAGAAQAAPAEEYESIIRKEAVNETLETRAVGKHWVGDLAMEGTVQVTGPSGQVLLDLVEGGVHYTCRIDVATGVAKLEIDAGESPFVDSSGAETLSPEAQTSLRGLGEYHLRFSNCDDELLLWINDELVQFNAPTTYATRPDRRPHFSASDPGDMAPAGIGSDGAAFTVSSLRILRDLYYIASDGSDGGDGRDYEYYVPPSELLRLFTKPALWEGTELFEQRKSIPFALEAGQYFPLGDNSPQSQDARSWGAPPYVERKLLIGKALVIYWPHAWNAPIPFTPNVPRMGIIR